MPFASIVTRDCCQLYCVLRTDLTDRSKIRLTYPPSDYMTAVRRAEIYQQEFDPEYKRYDYRVSMCS